MVDNLTIAGTSKMTLLSHQSVENTLLQQNVSKVYRLVGEDTQGGSCASFLDLHHLSWALLLSQLAASLGNNQTCYPRLQLGKCSQLAEREATSREYLIRSQGENPQEYRLRDSPAPQNSVNPTESHCTPDVSLETRGRTVRLCNPHLVPISRHSEGLAFISGWLTQVCRWERSGSSRSQCDDPVGRLNEMTSHSRTEWVPACAEPAFSLGTPCTGSLNAVF